MWEIGPGSGRYLERVYRRCKPSYYEIYETSDDWAQWLVSSYNVVWQPTDGLSLASTATASIDFVHSHKVFAGQPSLIILRYLSEMARVVRSGGKIVFDMVTERCMDDDTVQRWWDAHSGYQHYPCLFPRGLAIDYLERRGLRLDGAFLADMKPGATEYFVFTRR
jgi:SAM-dependent methyltransferase